MALLYSNPLVRAGVEVNLRCGELDVHFRRVERVIGRVEDKHGNFVPQHVGVFKDGVATSRWSVVPASGTEDLQGLRGEVHSTLGHAKSYPVEFSYELE